MRRTRKKADDIEFTRVPDADGRRMLRTALGGGAGSLLGAALGATGGLLGEAFIANPEKAQYIRRMLQGAGIGGLAGLGLGAGFGYSQTAADLHQDLDNYIEDALNSVTRTQMVVNTPIVGESTVSFVSPGAKTPRANA